MAVSRACVLAREIIDIVRGYNETLARSGLPNLEIGIGISYQEAAPLYLMDGNRRIMISDAVNESDRLSSCNKRVRKAMETRGKSIPRLHVSNGQRFRCRREYRRLHFALQCGRHLHERGGIPQTPAGSFDLSLLRCTCRYCGMKKAAAFFTGLVPLGNDIFRKIAVRESRVAQIDLRTFYIATLDRPALLRSVRESRDLRGARKED